MAETLPRPSTTSISPRGVDSLPDRGGPVDEEQTEVATPVLSAENTAAGRPVGGGLLDRMVDGTPVDRDRTVDFLRACCIAMVVIWHWSLSMNNWSDGTLSMPNPIDQIPWAWTATWVLQVMPLFFVIGGFANRAAWSGAKAKAEVAATARATSAGTETCGTPGADLANVDATGRSVPARAQFVRGRLKRMVVPVVAMLASWAVLDAVLVLAIPAYTGVLTWGFAVFVPLWFLAIYGVVTALSPRTVEWFDRRPVGSLAVLAGAVAGADIARFALELPGSTHINTLMVFLFAHQLGHAWHAGLLTDPVTGRRNSAVLALAGGGLMLALTTFGPYSQSMVAVSGEGISNMNPTTAPIAGLAMFQLGLVGLARPVIERLCARRRVWKATIALNAVAMTVFTWHMTALAAVMGLVTLAGVQLGTDATLTWWLARPFWLLAPGVVLAALLAVFARLELPGRD